MRQILITTPDNVEIKYRLAGAGSRMGAAVIDMMVQLLLALVFIGIPIFMYLQDLFDSQWIMEHANWVFFILVIGTFSIYFGYYIIAEMITGGQSIGKKILRLRVIRENGMPLTLGASMIRNIFRYIIDLYGIGVFLMLFSKRYKRLGDMVASTVVVDENVLIHSEALSLDMLTTQEINENGHLLSPGDRDIVKEYLSRSYLLPDEGNGVIEKLKEYLSDKYGLEPHLLDEEYLKKLI